MRRWCIPAVVVGFTAYSYLATTWTAAWFLRRAYTLSALDSLTWAAALYAPWLAVAALVWLVLRLLGPRVRGLVMLAILTLPLTVLTAVGMSAIDAAMRGLHPSFSAVMERSIDRMPITLLLYTAVAAMGLAIAHWRRSRDQGRELNRLHLELDRVRQAQAQVRPSSGRLMIAVGRNRVPVEANDIEWIGAAGNYVVVYWAGREGLLRETLSVLETRLAPLGFVRSHRSTLVNLARVRDLAPLSDGAWRLTLDSGAGLLVGRSYRDSFLARVREGR